MKNIKELLFLFICFISSGIYAQISFEEKEILGKSDVIINPRLFDNETLDIDQDGDFDILVHTNNNIVWYENIDGAGDFSSAKEIYGKDSFNVSKMQIADLDGDGDMDIACLTRPKGLGPNTIGWIINQGKGSFSDLIEIEEISINIYHFEIRDIDGDSDFDIIFNLSGEGIVWSENTDGQGAFAKHDLLLPFRKSIPLLTIEDVNGDSKIDLILYDFEIDQLLWYENLDNVIFSTSKQFQINLKIEPSFLKKVDIDKDDSADFIASFRGNDNLIWYEYNEDGSFNKKNINVNGSYLISCISTDIDNDGDSDLLGVESNRDLIWLENKDGKGIFSVPNVIEKEVCPSFTGNCDEEKMLATGDYDGNGTIDFFTSNIPASSGVTFGPGIIYVYSNKDGKGNFSSKKVISERLHAEDIRSIDIDNDGDLDILNINHGKTTIFKNIDGKGKFGKQEFVSTIDDIKRSITVDLDNDGDLDVVSSRFAPQKDLVWFENVNGLGTFAAAQVLNATLGAPHNIGAGDIDGDGYQDLIMLFSEDEKAVFWLKNLNGTVAFSDPIELTKDSDYPEYIELKDIDGDNDLDMVLFETYSEKVKWYENTDGLGNFSTPIELVDADSERGFHVADLDSDNDLDIITYGTEIMWYENTDGLGNFASSAKIGNPSSYISYVEVVDLDGDLDQDVVWKTYNNKGVFWFENLGDLQFGSKSTIFTNDNPYVNPVTAIGDFNGDLKADIVHAHGLEKFDGYNPARVIVLFNNGKEGSDLSLPDFKTSDCKMYPLPFANVLNVNCYKNNITQVDLYNTQGELLLSKFLNGSNESLNVSSLSQGLYIIKLRDRFGAIFIKKGIKYE